MKISLKNTFKLLSNFLKLKKINKDISTEVEIEILKENRKKLVIYTVI